MEHLINSVVIFAVAIVFISTLGIKITNIIKEV